MLLDQNMFEPVPAAPIRMLSALGIEITVFLMLWGTCTCVAPGRLPSNGIMDNGITLIAY